MNKYCCISLDMYPGAVPISLVLEGNDFEDVYLKLLVINSEPLTEEMQEEEREHFDINAQFDLDKDIEVATIYTDDEECLLTLIKLPDTVVPIVVSEL